MNLFLLTIILSNRFVASNTQSVFFVCFMKPFASIIFILCSILNNLLINLQHNIQNIVTIFEYHWISCVICLIQIHILVIFLSYVDLKKCTLFSVYTLLLIYFIFLSEVISPDYLKVIIVIFSLFTLFVLYKSIKVAKVDIPLENIVYFIQNHPAPIITLLLVSGLLVRISRNTSLYYLGLENIDYFTWSFINFSLLIPTIILSRVIYNALFKYYCTRVKRASVLVNLIIQQLFNSNNYSLSNIEFTFFFILSYIFAPFVCLLCFGISCGVSTQISGNNVAKTQLFTIGSFDHPFLYTSSTLLGQIGLNMVQWERYQSMLDWTMTSINDHLSIISCIEYPMRAPIPLSFTFYKGLGTTWLSLPFQHYIAYESLKAHCINHSFDNINWLIVPRNNNETRQICNALYEKVIELRIRADYYSKLISLKQPETISHLLGYTLLLSDKYFLIYPKLYWPLGATWSYHLRCIDFQAKWEAHLISRKGEMNSIYNSLSIQKASPILSDYYLTFRNRFKH